MMGHSDGSTTSRYYLQANAQSLADELSRANDWAKMPGWDILGRE